jgi:hypothetical protein
MRMMASLFWSRRHSLSSPNERTNERPYEGYIYCNGMTMRLWNAGIWPSSEYSTHDGNRNNRNSNNTAAAAAAAAAATNVDGCWQIPF